MRTGSPSANWTGEAVLRVYDEDVKWLDGSPAPGTALSVR